MKKKAPSCSGILLPMHVVLKTRHVNPNIHVRRFIVHVRSPNLSATRLQLLPLRGSNNLIEVISQSYIGISPKLYSFLRHPILLYPRTHIGQPADQYRFAPPSPYKWETLYRGTYPFTLPRPFITNKRARLSNTLTLQNTSAVASLKKLKKSAVGGKKS